MLDTITVKVSDLYDLVKQMHDDGMTYVEISINDSLDAGLDDGDIIPPCVSFLATSDDDPFGAEIDYEHIDGIEND